MKKKQTWNRPDRQREHIFLRLKGNPKCQFYDCGNFSSDILQEGIVGSHETFNAPTTEGREWLE